MPIQRKSHLDLQNYSCLAHTLHLLFHFLSFFVNSLVSDLPSFTILYPIITQQKKKIQFHAFFSSCTCKQKKNTSRGRFYIKKSFHVSLLFRYIGKEGRLCLQGMNIHNRNKNVQSPGQQHELTGNSIGKVLIATRRKLR